MGLKYLATAQNEELWTMFCNMSSRPTTTEGRGQGQKGQSVFRTHGRHFLTGNYGQHVILRAEAGEYIITL